MNAADYLDATGAVVTHGLSGLTAHFVRHADQLDRLETAPPETFVTYCGELADDALMNAMLDDRVEFDGRIVSSCGRCAELAEAAR